MGPDQRLLTPAEGSQNLAERNLWLALEVTPERTGIGLVRARNGAVYKLWLAEVEGHPDALRRRVRIGYAAAPLADSGGGELRLTKAAGAPVASERRAIREAIEVGRRVPGQNDAQRMSGAYEVLTERGEELRVAEKRHLIVDGSPPGKVSL
ncbi:MAG: hypothetical protein AAF628_20480 [Planctomycetota bacterium]